MTAQTPEKLVYEGEIENLCATPLEDYFRASETESPFSMINTSLYRGYVGVWDIIDDRLYLVRLEEPDLRFVNGAPEFYVAPHHIQLSDIFPDRDIPVFADWYTGQLRCPQGELKDYVHGGFGSVYERDLLINIESGVVTGTETRTNTHGAPKFDSSAFAFASCGNCGFDDRLRYPRSVIGIMDKRHWPVWCGDCGKLSLSDYKSRPLLCAECGSKKVSGPNANRQRRPSDPEYSWAGFKQRLKNIWLSILGKYQPEEVIEYTYGNVYTKEAIYRCPQCGEFEMQFKAPFERFPLE